MVTDYSLSRLGWTRDSKQNYLRHAVNRWLKITLTVHPSDIGYALEETWHSKQRQAKRPGIGFQILPAFTPTVGVDRSQAGALNSITTLI
jgi:hypothetical protein